MRSWYWVYKKPHYLLRSRSMIEAWTGHKSLTIQNYETGIIFLRFISWDLSNEPIKSLNIHHHILHFTNVENPFLFVSSDRQIASGFIRAVTQMKRRGLHSISMEKLFYSMGFSKMNPWAHCYILSFQETSFFAGPFLWAAIFIFVTLWTAFFVHWVTWDAIF